MSVFNFTWDGLIALHSPRLRNHDPFPDPSDPLSRLRNGMIGRDAMLATPFGERLMVYADYTASGRALRQVETQIESLSGLYANPHTVDSATGRASSVWMHQAEAIIRQAVNAAPEDCLIACSSGATGAIHKLQEILGLAIAPASRDRMVAAIAARLGPAGLAAAGLAPSRRRPTLPASRVM